MENPFKHISPLRIGVSSHYVIIAILLCPSNFDVTFSLDSQSSTNTMDEMKNYETKTILTVISDYFSFGNYTFPIFVYIVLNLLAIPFYLNKKLFVTPEVKEF